MLTAKEKLELEELEKINKSFNIKDNRELEDNYEYDNRLGALLVLVSYCGIGVFILYKVAELLLKNLI
ncbi:hypothetical protein [uncultured Fusobacterium sp.]|jgi:hypothetical protein|uniref:Uncharacterized protein n=1 Tax=Candidatus Fusobacterium pullicola TaxID=2838601 RepID=A0A9E2L137_9FUSO|nr:hypothetical protein [Fusobacterium sp.]MBU3843215.1 hypothetical protein [Candidatus Fusobacterium pullicola]MDO5788130.1 hypothetical protein [Fusobacterium sp.]